MGSEYWQVDVIVEGALSSAEVFTDETDVDAFVAQQETLAKDGLGTEVFILFHGHSLDVEECSCAQYVTDGRPQFSWNTLADEEGSR